MNAHRRYRYQADGLLRWMGLTDLTEVTQDVVNQFRLKESGLSPVTIENYIKAVGILTGRKFNGKKLRKKQKRPELVALEDLGAVYQVARKNRDTWFCLLLKFGYITGLRHADLVGMQRSSITPTSIEVEASKTGKMHYIPRHAILRGPLPGDERPLYRNVKTVYKWLNRYCEEADVPHFTLQMIRRTAANEYEKAHPGAGGVLLGHSLGSVTYSYYLDQFEVLRVAQRRLVIPEVMLPKGRRWRQQAEELELVEAFRGLPEDERRTVLRLMGRVR